MYKSIYIFTMPFTWDEKKRRKNMKDRQLDFADAEKVFHGPMRVFEDTRFDYDERRWVGIGFLGLTLVVIVFTETEDETHIISMRKAALSGLVFAVSSPSLRREGAGGWVKLPTESHVAISPSP